MGRSLLFVLIGTFTAFGQDWTWCDAKGKQQDRAVLDRIVAQHQLWLESRQTKGMRANLHGTKLVGVDLSSLNLSEANLSAADISNARLAGAILEHADLSGANLRGTVLVGSSLRGALLVHADLSDALLGNADLGASRLYGTVLLGADLSGSNMAEAMFEPKDSPDLVSVANARGVDAITWDSNPRPVFALRKALVDAGFSRAARQLTAAIHRHNQNLLERIVFDWTSEWGANALRPLELIGAVFCCFALVYWLGLHAARPGLFLVATGQRITTSKGIERVFRLPARTPHRRRYPFSKLIGIEHFRGLRRWPKMFRILRCGRSVLHALERSDPPGRILSFPARQKALI